MMDDYVAMTTQLERDLFRRIAEKNAEIERLRARLAEAEQDAVRYRKVRHPDFLAEGLDWYADPESFDAWVDGYEVTDSASADPTVSQLADGRQL